MRIIKRQIRRLDQMRGQTTGKLLAILGLLMITCEISPISFTTVLATGLECVCLGLDGLEYVLTADSGLPLEAVKSIRCDHNKENHCVCSQDGVPFEVDFPSIDWESVVDEELPFDFTCDIDALRRQAHDRNKRSTTDTPLDTETIDATETKTNILSRGIKGVGNVFYGTGRLASSVVKTVGNATEGAIHLVGKATRYGINSVGNIVNGTGRAIGGAFHTVGGAFEGKRDIEIKVTKPTAEISSRTKRSVKDIEEGLKDFKVKQQVLMNQEDRTAVAEGLRKSLEFMHDYADVVEHSIDLADAKQKLGDLKKKYPTLAGSIEEMSRSLYQLEETDLAVFKKIEPHVKSSMPQEVVEAIDTSGNDQEFYEKLMSFSNDEVHEWTMEMKKVSDSNCKDLEIDITHPAITMMKDGLNRYQKKCVIPGRLMELHSSINLYLDHVEGKVTQTRRKRDTTAVKPKKKKKVRTTGAKLAKKGDVKAEVAEAKIAHNAHSEVSKTQTDVHPKSQSHSTTATPTPEEEEEEEEDEDDSDSSQCTCDPDTGSVLIS